MVPALFSVLIFVASTAVLGGIAGASANAVALSTSGRKSPFALRNKFLHLCAAPYQTIPKEPTSVL